MSHYLWLSSESMTVIVKIENGIIVQTPPVIANFRGQSANRLINWMKRQPGFQMEKRIK